MRTDRTEPEVSSRNCILERALEKKRTEQKNKNCQHQRFEPFMTQTVSTSVSNQL